MKNTEFENKAKISYFQCEEILKNIIGATILYSTKNWFQASPYNNEHSKSVYFQISSDVGDFTVRVSNHQCDNYPNNIIADIRTKDGNFYINKLIEMDIRCFVNEYKADADQKNEELLADM